MTAGTSFGTWTLKRVAVICTTLGSDSTVANPAAGVDAAHAARATMSPTKVSREMNTLVVGSTRERRRGRLRPAGISLEDHGKMTGRIPIFTEYRSPIPRRADESD
jgi:hypothetical protein